MPPLPLSLGRQSNPGFDPHAGIASLLNCYAAVELEGQKSGYTIQCCDGLAEFATLSGAEGGGRAAIVVGNTLYVLMGKTLFSVDPSGTATLRGAIPSTGHATMCVNRQQPYQQVSIVSDGLSFILQNNVLSEVPDSNLGPSVASAFLDGYFVHGVSGGIGRFQTSNIDEGTIFDPLDFASAESKPDPLVTVAVNGPELVLPGTKSTEFYANTPNQDAFSFSRLTSKDYGCASARSVQSIAVLTPEQVTATLAWVATDKDGRPSGVILIDGYNARKISSAEVERLIQAEADPSAIRATSWVSRGHAFYAITGSNWTWVYDTATSAWHERSSRVNGVWGPWRVSVVVAFAGMLIALDATQGKLYKMSHEYHDEAGDPLLMRVDTPPVTAYPERLTHDAVWLDVVPGVGQIGQEDITADLIHILGDSVEITADMGLSPEHEAVYPDVLMSWTEDGKTWSTPQPRQLGRAGQTGTRVYWRRLGTANSHGRTYRFACSAPVVRGFLGANFEGKKIRA